MIEEQKFRRDFFYRLSVLSIEIPPLRERREDIRCLIHSRKKYLKGKEIGEGFWEAILEYQWPGNIRELFSVMKRAGILGDSPVTGGQIKALIRKDGGQASCSQEEIRSISIWERLQAGRDFWEVLGEPFLNRELTREQMKNIVDQAFVQARGKYINTLKTFNLPPAHYRRFMKFLHKHHLQ
jgi:transcriptional regulator with PAS, ATPase and Fis domain